MRKLLDLCGLVPSWAYAAVVLLLVGLVLIQEVGRQRALADAAQAGQALASLQRDHATALATAVQRARTAEAVLSVNLMRETNDLQARLADRDQRISDLAGRLHQHARPVNFVARAGCSTAGSASPSDGQRDPGLRDLAGVDLVVLDGQARLELARYAVSARDTGEALKSCRRLLRDAWRAP